jgi:hypothetical protein
MRNLVETSLHHSNLLRAMVMEDGQQKSKTLIYMAKFRREVLWCTEDKGNCKAAAVLKVDESNVRLRRKQKAAISGREVSRKKFAGPKKGRFPEIDDAILTFSQEMQDWNKLYCIILRHAQWFYHFSNIQLSIANLIPTCLKPPSDLLASKVAKMV